MSVEAKPRPQLVKKRCANCNHVESFHPDHEWCCSYGCECKQWAGAQKAEIDG